MTNNTIKKKAHIFLKNNSLTTIDYNSLCNTMKNAGYTIIEFNCKVNDENVTTVIHNLNLDNYIKKSRGFTYISDRYRLIFINDDLNDNEKLLVLSHETGHIVCEHFMSTPIIGKDVEEEHEANEFVHWLLNPTLQVNIRNFINTKKKSAMISFILIISIAITLLTVYYVKKEKSYYGEYYITTTGSKYHEKECIFVKNKNNTCRLTKEEFETGDYEACEMCLP